MLEKHTGFLIAQLFPDWSMAYQISTPPGEKCGVALFIERVGALQHLG